MKENEKIDAGTKRWAHIEANRRRKILDLKWEAKKQMKIEENLNELKRWATMVANSKSWNINWDRYVIANDLYPKGQQTTLTVGEALALCHSELSEALEAYRDDDKVHFSEEIADEFIRLLHLCGDLNIDIVKAINEKILKNQERPVKHGRANF